jgi:hypothetical protein
MSLGVRSLQLPLLWRDEVIAGSTSSCGKRRNAGGSPAGLRSEARNRPQPYFFFPPALLNFEGNWATIPSVSVSATMSM